MSAVNVCSFLRAHLTREVQTTYGWALKLPPTWQNAIQQIRQVDVNLEKNVGRPKMELPQVRWMVYTCWYWKIPISKLWMIRVGTPSPLRKPPNGLCVNHPRYDRSRAPRAEPSCGATPRATMRSCHLRCDHMCSWFRSWGAYFGVQFPVRSGCLCGLYIYIPIMMEVISIYGDYHHGYIN